MRATAAAVVPEVGMTVGWAEEKLLKNKNEVGITSATRRAAATQDHHFGRVDLLPGVGRPIF
jgi:hypothetical protein